MNRPPRPRRHGAAIASGWVLGALAALPALAIAPWMLIGLMVGIDGRNISSGEPGPTDWGAILVCSTALLVCVAGPVLVGWGSCRLLDLALRGRSGQPGHQLPR
ncbi:hypothetical protein [Klenkia taihuensis]|uniref:Uncharacterized protein n=1 Tax=Klenkia taihuensis TaxID=1225127 RepID=A0A1I1QAL9_9ACTN|nr:hypothetical protein [Klenkia taihuensis]SFD19184.1 hypothetical protein SAMN05661030_2689 [Klenkia taihuensis]